MCRQEKQVWTVWKIKYTDLCQCKFSRYCCLEIIIQYRKHDKAWWTKSHIIWPILTKCMTIILKWALFWLINDMGWTWNFKWVHYDFSTFSLLLRNFVIIVAISCRRRSHFLFHNLNFVHLFVHLSSKISFPPRNYAEIITVVKCEQFSHKFLSKRFHSYTIV